jgi:hypothetical protein
MSPLIYQIASKFAGKLKVVKIDGDANPKLVVFRFVPARPPRLALLL